MSDNRTEGKHELQILDCASGRISGVKEVLAFDTEGIRLDTVCGRLTIRGKDMHISQLSVENGCIMMIRVILGLRVQLVRQLILMMPRVMMNYLR